MSTNEPIIIRGKCHLHSETGTEGGHWALQDERFIEPPTPEWPHERWSYDGLNYLEDGDHLKIFDPEGSIYWEGSIQLKRYPVFTEAVDVHDESTGANLGIWIHADQAGIDRKFWATPFFKEYRAELIKGLDKTPEV
jgi:hypothetical protein